MLIRVGKIYLLEDFFHTDLKDLKDCYAASGYAVINKRCARTGRNG